MLCLALMNAMTTGVLARRTGLTLKTVRAYADAGLIYSVGRTAAGHRLFEDEALWCVATIRGLRGLGLTVAEIGSLGAAAHRGLRLADLLDAAAARTATRIVQLQDTLERIEAFRAENRAELAGEADFNGDPRRPGV